MGMNADAATVIQPASSAAEDMMNERVKPGFIVETEMYSPDSNEDARASTTWYLTTVTFCLGFGTQSKERAIIPPDIKS